MTPDLYNALFLREVDLEGFLSKYKDIDTNSTREDYESLFLCVSPIIGVVVKPFYSLCNEDILNEFVSEAVIRYFQVFRRKSYRIDRGRVFSFFYSVAQNSVRDTYRRKKEIDNVDYFPDLDCFGKTSVGKIEAPVVIRDFRSELRNYLISSMRFVGENREKCLSLIDDVVNNFGEEEIPAGDKDMAFFKNYLLILSRHYIYLKQTLEGVSYFPEEKDFFEGYGVIDEEF